MLVTTDERGALFSKVLAWGDRSRKQSADKDAFDIWRMLEVCQRAKVQPHDWPESFEESGWREIIRRDFGARMSAGCQALERYLQSSGHDPATAVTRTMALLNAVVGKT